MKLYNRLKIKEVNSMDVCDIMKVLNNVRFMIRKVLGVPDTSFVIYKSDFPDGQLIGEPTQVGAFSIIDYGGNVKIGKNVKIGYGVVVLSVSTITGAGGENIIRKPTIIGDNVEIGSNSVILPGVAIGENSTIGAGAVVTNDIPSNSIAVGIPAKVVKKNSPPFRN